MDMKKILPVIIVAVIIIGAGAFYGGLKFADAKKPAAGQFGEFQAQRGQGAGAGGVNLAMAGRKSVGQGGGQMSGEILSIDDKSVTIKLNDGGSKIAFFSTSTEVSKYTAGSISDLVAGTNVMVLGKANADGSVIAQTIQIRPAGFRAPGAPTGVQN